VPPFGRAFRLPRLANLAGESGVRRSIEDKSMSDDNPYIVTFTASDGSTWTRPMPAFVRRELAACRAMDALALHLSGCEDIIKRARDAAAVASAATPRVELIATWREQTDALTRALEDATIASADLIDKVQIMLGLK
jgi:hypothetical protein